MVTYDRLSSRFLTLSTGITRDGRKDIRVILDLNTNFFYTLDDDDNFQRINQNDGYNFIQQFDDLPSPSNGIITLEDNKTYLFTTTIDLVGNRIVCGENTVLLGGSSENCRIKSTGLIGSPLISSNYSIPIRNITLESDVVFNLSGDSITTAIDWFGVNITDSRSGGTISNYSNIIFSDCAFLNSGGLTFDGSIGTIGINNSLFDTINGGTSFTLLPSLIVTRRFRIIYSSFVTLVGETSINISTGTTLPSESFILDTVNFAGGGTYVTGVTQTSNKSLFSKCVGIENTAVNGQLYMRNNTTPTIITGTTNFTKVLGTTTASTDNAKYSHTNNRLTNEAIVKRKYLIQCTLSFTSGNNNVCEFAFYDSKLRTLREPSIVISTGNSSGRAENIAMGCVVEHSIGDYIEIWSKNTSSPTNITVTNMNFIITQIN